MTKQAVIDFLTHGFQLANLPDSFIKLRQIANDPHSDIDDVVHVAKQDQELAASLLKLANSTLYSNGADHVGTIEEAAQRIGLSKVVENALALGIVKRIEMGSANFDLRSYWRRSITVGRIAEDILQEAPRLLRSVVDRQHLYTAGLLHDIGLLALIQGFPEEMRNVFDWCAYENAPLVVIERREFGFTHQDVGRILFKKWNLPEELQCVAGYHHEPLELRRRLLYPLVDLIHISEYLCCVSSKETTAAFKPIMIDAVWRRSGIDDDLIDTIRPLVDEAYESADTILAC